MKQVIWGGFCLIAGILLFWMLNVLSFTIDNGVIDAVSGFIVKFLAVALGIYGFILGCRGLKKD